MEMVETRFIIEVNKGIYLKVNRSEGSCTFTNNPRHATSFKGGSITAINYEKKCGGKLKRFTATYEVED